MPPRPTVEERFWSKVDTSAGPDGCWLWTAGIFPAGYGEFKLEGRPRQSHRVAWWLLRGLIPDGLELDHLCRVRACVNPAHLEPVTHRENLRRGESFWKAKTHCKQGHEFDLANTYYHKNRRQCRKCGNAASKRRYAQMHA